ncbi:MAG TPA: LPD38 domain-containing protein [Anaerovoracaceae bacterium]|nr:LPD38 domain-containing protein [Anaerovoracaceae bacterium]
MLQPKKLEYNPDAINDAYKLFVDTGYKKSREEFKTLIQTNPEALNDAYKLFVDTGYKKDINSFSELLGVKKKEKSASASQKQNLEYTSVGGGLDAENFSETISSVNKTPEQRKLEQQAKSNMSLLKPFEDRLYFDQSLQRAVPAKEKVRELTTAFTQNTSVTPEDEAAVRKEIDDNINNKGFWNTTKDVFLSAFLGNRYTDQRGTGKWELEKEINQVKAELKKGEELTDAELIESAKQLKASERLKEVQQSKINNYMSGLSDTEQDLLFGDNVNKLKSVTEVDKTLLKEIEIKKNSANEALEDFEIVKSSIEQKQEQGLPVPQEEIDIYNSIAAELKAKSDDLNLTFDKYVLTNEKLGTLEEEFDILKRNYDWSENFWGRLGMSSKEMALGVLDFINYSNEMRGGINQLQSLQGFQFTKEQRDKIDKQRESLRKNIGSVESPADFVNYVTDLVAEQVPVLATVATGPGGLGVLGLSGTGNKYSEMKDEVMSGDKSFTPFQMATSPLLHGGAEVIAEIPTMGILKKVGRVMKAPGADDLIKKSALKKAGEWTADYAADMGKELTAETVTNTIQNLNKIIIEGDASVNIQDGLEDVWKDTATITTFLKIAPHIAGRAMKPFQDKESQKTLIKNAEAIKMLTNKLSNPSLLPATRSEIEATVERLTKESSNITVETIKAIEKLPDAVYREVLEIDKKSTVVQSKAREIQNDTSIDDSTKKGLAEELKKEYDSLTTRRDEILKADYTPNPAAESNNNQSSKPSEIKASQESKSDIPEPNQISIEAAKENDITADGSIRPDTASVEQDGVPSEQITGKEEIQPAADTGTGEAAPKTYRLGATDKAGDYTVALNNGRLDIKDSKGNEPSAPTRRKIEDLYADEFDFTASGTAQGTGNQENPSFDIAEESNNPAEVARALLDMDNQSLFNENIDYKDRIIAEHIGKIKRSSFIENSDANNITFSIARAYLSNDGRPIDAVAEEMSDIAGTEITEQDIVDFILANRNGPQSLFAKVKRENRGPLEQKFTALTGLPPKERYLKKAVEQLAQKMVFEENYATEIDYLTEEELLSLQIETEQFNREYYGEEEGSITGITELLQAENNGRGRPKPRVQGKSGREDRGSESQAGNRQRERRSGIESARSIVSPTNDGTGNRRTSGDDMGLPRAGKPESAKEQEQLLKEYAQDSGLWLDENAIISSQAEQLPSGKEAKVYLSKDGKTVTKIINYSVYSTTPSDFIEERLLLFNELFPETAYDITGFTENDKGFAFVVEQPFIKGQPLSRIATLNVDMPGQQQRVKDFMQERFDMTEDGLDAVGNETIRVMDLHLRNVIEGDDGNLYVIDAIPEYKEKEGKQPKTNNAGNEQATQARNKQLVTERIKPLRRSPKNSPKKLNQIIAEAAAGLKSTIIYGRTRSKGGLGTYSPSNTLIRLKKAGDIDTAAHEIGHLLDDRFAILNTVPAEQELAVTRQLKWFADRGGSNPPDKLTAAKKREYLQREGIAEFIYAYIANPEQAKLAAPELFEHFENSIDDKTMEVLSQFSDDFIDFANASHGERLLANVEDSNLRDKKGFKEWLGRFNGEDGRLNITPWDNINAHVFNSMAIANKAFRFYGGLNNEPNLLPEKNFEMISRLFSGINGKTDRVLKNGMIDARNTLLKDSEGNQMNVEWLLAPLDSTSEKTVLSDIDETIKYLIAERTIEYAKKFGRLDDLTGIGGGIDADIDIAQGYLEEFNDLKNTNKEKYDRIKEAAKRYRQFADAGLQYAVQKGRLSKEQYQQIKDSNKYYVSLARVKENSPMEEADPFVNMNSGGIASVKDVIKKAKGGTLQIQNPYVSLLQNTVNIIKESDRNEVLSSFIEPLNKIREMGDGTPTDFSQIARPAATGDKNVKPIYVNGKEERWQFAPDIFKALTGLEGAAKSDLVDWLAKPGDLIRFTVTNFPTFALRNAVRDTTSRLLVSRTNSGLKEFIQSSTDKELFELYGGSQAGYYLVNKEGYRLKMQEAVKEITNKGGIVLNPKSWYRGYRKILERGENLNRIAEFKSAYKKALKEGLDEYNAGLYAAYQARDLMDFAVAGHTIRTLNRIIPFLNAGIQGMVRTKKAATENPTGFAVRTALYTILPTLLFRQLITAMGDDEEYEQLPGYQRDLFWNFKTPFTGNVWISIPKPFEQGMVSSAVDRAISQLKGAEKPYEGFAGSLVKTLTPVDESSLLGGLRPFFEVASNYDYFTGRHIVPAWEEGKLLELRGGAEKASRIAKTLSFGTTDPRYVDHVIKGYTTYMGDWGLALGDLGVEDSRFRFGPSKTGFAKDVPINNSRSVQAVYNLATELGRWNSRDIKRLRGIIESYYEEEDPAKQEAISKKIYARAKEIRKELEAKKAEIKKASD